VYCPVCHADYPADWKACPKDTTHLLKSPHIGKYKIEGLLGVGGMGAVYRASNPDTKGRVAVKVMNPAVAGAESARARFQREAAAVAALRTAHVVKVFDFGAEPDGTLYLVMELMDGHTLREEIMPAPNYMDLARVQMVMEGALKGLAAAHRSGIVHRDLKPENVFVADTDDGEVPKLLDFGIARVRTRDSDLTRTGSLMGTASYMATEQIAAGVGEIGPWSDVYAMGAIMYEMLAGTAAFGGNTVTEVLQRVLKSESVPLASVRQGLPPSIYQLIERCMSSTPSQRPQDAEAMRGALANARLVPHGATVPPPFKTKVEQAAGSSVGMMATEGRDTPNPMHTPQPAYDQRQQILGSGGSGGMAQAHGMTVASNPHLPVASGGMMPGAGMTPSGMPGAQLTPSGGVAGPITGTGVGGSAIGTGPNTGRGYTDSVERPAKKRALWPFAILGIAAAGVGGFFIVRGLQKPAAVAEAPRDARVVAEAVDAKQEPDASRVVVAETDAAKQQVEPSAFVFADTMVHFAGKTYEVGEDKPPNSKALSKQKVDLAEFWIDRQEITLGELRTALRNPKLGGKPTDSAAVPARFVTWAQAHDACKALGKRLPSEHEWETAALTTPRDTSKATMCTVCAASKEPVLTPSKKTDCSADGLCDMLGGVLEWTEDAGVNATRVVRGSSYAVSPDAGWLATINARVMVAPKSSDHEIGFRCAASRDASAPTGAIIPTPPSLTPTKDPKLPPVLLPKPTCPAGQMWSTKANTCVNKPRVVPPSDPWKVKE